MAKEITEIDLNEIYLNNQVFCPVCAWTGKRFLPFNGNPDAMCPVCNSSGRHRGEVVWLNESSNIFDDHLQVLHFAPEKGLGALLSKQENIDYISADIRKNAAKICADITALPFSDEMFDVIVCNHLLEHIEDDYKAIGEMYRVLKRGGWALVSYPVYVEETFEDFSIISEEERERVFKQKDHVRLCGLDYCKRLQQMGFDTRFMNYSDYSDEERQVLGLTNFPNSVFYVCWK